MIVKGHEAKATLLPSGALLHDVDTFDLAVLLKVLPDVVLLGVFLDATNKDLLDGQVGAWFVGVLGQSEESQSKQMRSRGAPHTTGEAARAFFAHLSRHGPLGFNDSPIHLVRPRFHGLVDLLHRGVRDKAKSS